MKDVRSAWSWALLVALGAAAALSSGESASAQERPAFEMPDSIRVVHESFYVPSMSPFHSFVSPPRFERGLTMTDQFMLGQDMHFGKYSAAWKRSFLLGVPVTKINIISPSPWMAKKESFFEAMQIVLGVAELVGVGYVAYESIKNEQSKKK